MRHVSRLSHSHRWEAYQYQYGEEEKLVLYLTSLSVRNDGDYVTLKIAQLTDFLISIGLGQFCDAIQMIILAFKCADYKAIATSWNEIKR